MPDATFYAQGKQTSYAVVVGARHCPQTSNGGARSGAHRGARETEPVGVVESRAGEHGGDGRATEALDVPRLRPPPPRSSVGPMASRTGLRREHKVAGEENPRRIWG